MSRRKRGTNSFWMDERCSKLKIYPLLKKASTFRSKLLLSSDIDLNSSEFLNLRRTMVIFINCKSFKEKVEEVAESRAPPAAETEEDAAAAKLIANLSVGSDDQVKKTEAKEEDTSAANEAGDSTLIKHGCMIAGDTM